MDVFTRIPSDDPEGRRAGTFAPGNVGHPKPLGLHNKITRDLKAGIVEAAERYGSDSKGEGGLVGYLYFLAGKHPKAFASLLGRLMPLQVNGNLGTFIGAVNIVPVPQDRYLSSEQIKQLAPVLPPVVEPADRMPDPDS